LLQFIKINAVERILVSPELLVQLRRKKEQGFGKIDDEIKTKENKLEKSDLETSVLFLFFFFIWETSSI